MHTHTRTHRTGDLRDVAMACVASPIFSDSLRYCYEEAVFGLAQMAYHRTQEEEEKLEKQYLRAVDRYINVDLPEWNTNRDRFVFNVLDSVTDEFPGMAWDAQKIRDEQLKARTAYAQSIARPTRPRRVRRMREEVRVTRGASEKQQQLEEQNLRDGMDVQVVGAKWMAYPHFMDTVRSVFGNGNAGEEVEQQV